MRAIIEGLSTISYGKSKERRQRH